MVMKCNMTEILLLLTLLLQTVLTANILYIAPFGSPSHHIWNKELALGLIEKGHTITMLSHHSEEVAFKDFNIITMEGLFEVVSKEFDMKTAIGADVFTSIKIMYDFTELSCLHDMETKGLQTLLNYPHKFDLIIIDVTLMQCMYPIIERFNNPPVVAINLLPPLLSSPFGYDIHPSYMPYFSSDFTNHMTLLERILNVIYVYAEYTYQKYVSLPKQFKIAKNRFGNNIHNFEEVEQNMSLMLVNLNPNFDYPMAFPPNIIPVGGLHIKPAKPLPKDLQEVVDNAPQGIILVSLGTNIRSDKLDIETQRAFLDAFAKLPQIVLWKFESDTIDDFPKNVIVRKWLPQRDILGHPKVKLFISQCGGFSSQEAMYHGVPVIGIPFIIDQFTIVRRIEQRKLGRFLDYRNLTSDNLYGAINEVLNNSIYKENMKKVSKRYRDEPQTALQKGIFWIEYVLRHGSAQHLVLPSRDMSAYQTANLDVLLFFILIMVGLYSFTSLLITGCRLVATQHSV